MELQTYTHVIYIYWESYENTEAAGGMSKTGLIYTYICAYKWMQSHLLRAAHEE